MISLFFPLSFFVDLLSFFAYYRHFLIFIVQFFKKNNFNSIYIKINCIFVFVLFGQVRYIKRNF